MKFLLGCLLLALQVIGALSLWTDLLRTGTCRGNQVVPVPGSGSATGVSVLLINRNVFPYTVDVQITSNVQNIIAITIHRGARGQNGPVLYKFSGTLGFNVRQVFALVNQGSYSSDAQLSDLLNGLWYFQIDAAGFSTGICRGQVEHQDRAYSRLSAENTVPISSGSNARGTLLATYNFFDPEKDLALDVVHDVLKPTNAGLFVGSEGRPGENIFNFQSGASPFFADLEITINEQKQFLHDLMFFVVDSTINPDGDIRGQLIIIDYPDIGFTARLDAASEIPGTSSTAKGCALVSYDCGTRLFQYFIIHNVLQPIGAFAQAGDKTTNGEPLFSLSRAKSPIYGAKYLTAKEEYLLFTNSMYFNILTFDNPLGEIRGNIGYEFDWYAYLSGTNTVPPVTTENIGCATFKLVRNNYGLDYWLQHTVSDATFVEIWRGAEGQNGAKVTNFNRVRSPIIGSNVDVDDDDLENLVDNRLYVLIRNPANPVTGILRGQMKRIHPCTVTRDSKLTVPGGVTLTYDTGTSETGSGSGPTPSGSGPTPSGSGPTPSGSGPTPSGSGPTPSGSGPTPSGPTPSGPTASGPTAPSGPTEVSVPSPPSGRKPRTRAPAPPATYFHPIYQYSPPPSNAPYIPSFNLPTDFFAPPSFSDAENNGGPDTSEVSFINKKRDLADIIAKVEREDEAQSAQLIEALREIEMNDSIALDVQAVVAARNQKRDDVFENSAGANALIVAPLFLIVLLFVALI